MRLAAVLAGLLALLLLPRGSTDAAATDGFLALSGSEARDFVLPADVRPVKTLDLTSYGLTYERYQQHFGAAEVLGAQITVYRNATDDAVYVVGSHFPGITPRNSVRLSQAEATAVAEKDVGHAPSRMVDLMINPETGFYFFRVESRSFASRWVHWIDAGNGRVLNRYNAIQKDHGTGVKGDTKAIGGLTTSHGAAGHGAGGAHWDLFSADNRQQTYDKQNKNDPFIYYVTDSDNHWTLVTPDRQSPGHPALIDAQYYANQSDDYFLTRHGFDWLDCYGAMQSLAHYGKNYDNAFWNGTYTVYGDGDGVETVEFSGGLDIVAHEHTHGITECTSNSAEVFTAEPISSNCVRASGQSICADWWIGEDIDLTSDVTPGFRNMADPEEDADPDHYSEYVVTTMDSGGVHTNSAIPNHAYYLLVNGGLNASCSAPVTHDAAHCSDSDTQDNNLNVSGVGVADAEDVFFLAFTGLPSGATFCNARAASEAAAGTLFGVSSQERDSTIDAWVAVGLTDIACGLSSPTPTPTASPTPTAAPTPTASPTPTPPPDSDGDGVPDASDNCPNWPNPGQALPPWTVPAGDPDCDGFTTTNENQVGTVPILSCHMTTTLNDEPLPDRWPLDFNDSQTLNTVDVGSFVGIMGSTAPGPPYAARYDLAFNGIINSVDVGRFVGFLGKTCTP
jgi:bacillolysin